MYQRSEGREKICSFPLSKQANTFKHYQSLRFSNKISKLINFSESIGIFAAEDPSTQFVIQKHHASNLHFDFRIELDGVLVSWALPKIPTLNPAIRRLMIQTENHPLEYRHFEGVIPKGNYGAGTVMIWDEGSYLAKGAKDDTDHKEKVKQGLKNGKLEFELFGKKLQGIFTIIKIKNEKEWLLIKEHDRFISNTPLSDLSVVTNRTLNQIADLKLNPNRFPKTKMPDKVNPMLATLINKPFNAPEWFFEFKWDGVRAIAHLKDGSPRLYSRYFTDLSFYAPIIQSLKKIPYQAVLDGEIIVLDKNGLPSFTLLQNWKREKSGRLMYAAFDLLWLDGFDIQHVPLRERKIYLRQLLLDSGDLIFSDFIEYAGVELFEIAKKIGLEGLVAKNSLSIYKQKYRGKDWLKIKVIMQQEAIVIGYTKGQGIRKDLGALLLAVYRNNSLWYVGEVGTGFNEKLIKNLVDTFKPYITPDPPKIKNITKLAKNITWLKPHFVAEIKFQEWTNDWKMRQPVFLGLRFDKEPKEVVREVGIDEKNI